ncbi:MAG: group 1 glycosyl transferase [Bacteroidetes bacterium SW_9_63_38]|nr:MAG: group 1 glycosyl transferase [Bacteroidetes bacterium SW_9_63_38]
MDRRVLVLTYYFPPSGGPGVQRMLKFVKYLPDFGWMPSVLTVQDGAYPERDPSLGDDVPSEVPVHRTASWDPYQLYARFTGQSDDDAVVQGSMEGQESTWKESLARWVRANVFLPDARVGWVPFATWSGRQLLADGDYDAILTTGPPHSTHLAGALLQYLTGTPWVADFRDPWTDINYYHELPHTRPARCLDTALERMVLRRAQTVTTVSPTWRDLLLEKRGQNDGEAVAVVQNGFDEEDISPGQTEPATDTFEVTHVGSLYASRNPDGLWAALRRLREQNAVPKLRLRLVGSVAPNVTASLRRFGLTDITTTVSYVPHATAVDYMRQAGLLLLSIEEFPASEGMLTGKIYEYLAAGRPILGVGNPDGDAAELLRETEGGRLFGWQDVDGCLAFVRQHHESWTDGEALSGASAKQVRLYRRRSQTEDLTSILETVV